MKKTFLSAIALCAFVVLLNACQQPINQVDDGMDPTDMPQQGPAAQNYPDDNQSGYQGAPNAAGSPNSGAASGYQDYIDIPEDRPSGTSVAGQGEELPSMTYVNERLAEYSKKLDRWRELDRQSSATAASPEESAELTSCYQQLQKVMNGYSTLRANMLNSMSAGPNAVPVEAPRDLYKADIDFVESHCGLMLVEKSPTPQISDSTLQATGDTLLRNYAAGNYAATVQLWQALPADQGVRLRVSAQNAVAQAMLRQGDIKGAETIYKNLLKRLDNENSPDTLELRRRLADISFATGDSSEALRQYQQMGGDDQKLGGSADWGKRQAEMLATAPRAQQEEYAGLMSRWLAYVPERDGFAVSALADDFLRKYPQSPVADNVGYIRDDAKRKAERWIDGQASAADKMAARKKFQEEAQLARSAPANAGENERQEVVRGNDEDDSVGAAPDQVPPPPDQVPPPPGQVAPPPQVSDQELQRKWDNGLSLAQNKRYDDAIGVFTELQGSTMGDQAREKVRVLSLQAAQHDRRQAAELYQRYTKAPTLAAKKKLLLESHRILKNILDKYPNVEIAPKVSSNIARVEQEMRSLDPNLLQDADQPGPSPAYDQGAGESDGDDQ